MASERPVIVVTGGSRGIGLAIASRFIRRGFSAVLAARNGEALAAAARELPCLRGQVETLALDLREMGAGKELIAFAVSKFGRVDALVNNAGVAPLSPIDEMTDAEFLEVQQVNVQAMFACTRAVWPLMRAQKSGVILNTSSVSAVDPFPGFAVYGASKAWVNTFTLALGAEGAPLGIRTYSVAPGAVETALLRSRFPDFPAEQALSADELAVVFEELYDEKDGRRSGQTVVVRR